MTTAFAAFRIAPSVAGELIDNHYDLVDFVKHDFREQSEGEAVERFLAWLETETIDMLQQSRGDAESTKTAIFLYVNRAYEAHLPEEQIGALFGKCYVRSDHPDADQNAAFDLLEFFAQIAQGTHGGK